jgi:hypothetical protein
MACANGQRLPILKSRVLKKANQSRLKNPFTKGHSSQSLSRLGGRRRSGWNMSRSVSLLITVSTHFIKIHLDQAGVAQE